MEEKLVFSGITTTGDDPSSAFEADHGPLVQVYVVTIPAACSAFTLTYLPEPGSERVHLKPDVNGGGSLACTARLTREDANEPAETVTLTDSEAKLLEDPGRLVFTYTSGDTLSYLIIKERHATRIAR